MKNLTNTNEVEMKPEVLDESKDNYVEVDVECVAQDYHDDYQNGEPDCNRPTDTDSCDCGCDNCEKKENESTESKFQEFMKDAFIMPDDQRIYAESEISDVESLRIQVLSLIDEYNNDVSRFKIETQINAMLSLLLIRGVFSKEDYLTAADSVCDKDFMDACKTNKEILHGLISEFIESVETHEESTETEE